MDISLAKLGFDPCLESEWTCKLARANVKPMFVCICASNAGALRNDADI
jgi:hypothetical protein